MLALLTLATESGIPADDPRTLIAVPMGFLIFVGATYWLLRSNLGTRRAYLVMGTVLFAFMTFISLFWTFGAPGTPSGTGPTNLPGQTANAYQPTWVPFAPDSLVASDERYTVVKTFPEGFNPGEPGAEVPAAAGASDTLNFFSSEEGGSIIDATAGTRVLGHTTGADGRPIIAIELQATIQPSSDGSLPPGVAPEQIGQPDPAEEPVLVFALFDAGNRLFPPLVVFAISLLLLAVHAFALDRDEQRVKREAAQDRVDQETQPRVPTSAAT